MKHPLYDILIAIVVLLKVCFLVIILLSVLSHVRNWDSKIEFIETLKDEALTVSEVFMYLVLVVVFFPGRRVVDIKIRREEQLIGFGLGILGILHTQWSAFKGFFVDINTLIST